MALTYLTVKVSNPKKGKKVLKRRLLVDSGAVYSVLPIKELERLGIKPGKKQKFVLANNQEIEKEVGEARFSWNGFERTAPVVFGAKGVYLLGVTILEVMGLTLDPINRKLEQLPMIM